MRIPITMCHGTSWRRQPPLDAKHLEGHFRIASELGFQSIWSSFFCRSGVRSAATQKREGARLRTQGNLASKRLEHWGASYPAQSPRSFRQVTVR